MSIHNQSPSARRATSYTNAQQARRAISDQAGNVRLLAKVWTSEALGEREKARELELIATAEKHLWIAAEALRLTCAGTREKMTASPLPRED